jgi:hypothetical protein
MEIDYKKISNIELDGIDESDYPDFSDAYIVSALYDGQEMSDEMLDEINEDRDFVYEKVVEYYN